jgi:hypothetical protein
VTESDDEGIRYDDDAGSPERPFVVTNGRTRPAVKLDLVTLVHATRPAETEWDPIMVNVMSLCRTPKAIVEIAAGIGQPVIVAKILVSDLIANDAVRITRFESAFPQPTLELLESVRAGLDKL